MVKERYFFGIKHNVTTIVMLNYARGNMTTGKVGRGVKVSDEADSGNVVGLGIGRKGSHKIAIVVQRDILKAKLVQLFFKMLRKIIWPGVEGVRLVSSSL